MEPVAADLDPAGLHDAFAIQVVPLATVKEPARGHDTIPVHEVPLVVILGQLPAGEHTTVVIEEVQVVADFRPPDSHCAGLAQPVPTALVGQPARGHHTLVVQVVPGAPVLHPAGGHVTLGTQVEPLTVLLLPARHHCGGVIEEVAATVDGRPSADGAPVGARPVPAPTSREPAGGSLAAAHEAPGVARFLPRALTQAVGLGNTGRVGDTQGAHELGVAQHLGIRGGRHEGVLDDDAGHVFLTGLADDRVVVARGAVRVVVVGVVAGLDAAVGQPQRGQLVLDVTGELTTLRVGPIVVGRGVAVPDLRAARDRRGGVEVNRHERVSVGSCGHLDAA